MSGGGGGTSAGFNPYGGRGPVKPVGGGGGGGGTPSRADIDALLGNAPSGGVGVKPGMPGGGGSAPAPTFTNTTAPNPVSNTAIDEIMKRYQDKGTGGLDQGIRKLRANASMGIAGEMAANRARMGSSGTSQDSVDARELAQGQEYAINNMTTDFVLGREKEKDNLIQAYGRMGLDQSADQGAKSAQAFNQWATQQNLELQKKNDYLRSLQVVSSLLDKSSGIL